jgi:hypothetical protein
MSRSPLLFALGCIARGSLIEMYPGVRICAIAFQDEEHRCAQPEGLARQILYQSRHLNPVVMVKADLLSIEHTASRENSR